MKRTTILADEALLVEAKHLAAQEGKTFTAVVQDALRDYIQAHRTPRRISFAGMGRNAEPWTADSLNEELIAGLDPIEGWSPRRRPERPEAAADEGRRDWPS